MSAIWGAIDLSGGKIQQQDKDNLRMAFEECRIDRVEELSDGNVYMGCGIQYITKEAEKEKLPIQLDNRYFNADVILDNREELLQRLEKKNSINVADGEILRDYYDKYKDKALNDMLGAYCFVLYDKKTNKVEIVADAVGYRFVYYTIKDQILYYSSLMAPLEKVQNKCVLNKRYVGDYLLQDNLNIFTECEETPIQNIYRIAPAQKLIISLKEIQKVQYWNPTKRMKQIRYKTDAEYKQHFRRLYQECVTSLLRANGETAMLLSGGFDSTSVAAFAVPELKRRGKKMYAFTSVPFQGYESEFEDCYMVDETEAVQKTVEYYGNIECEYMDLPEMNPWYDRKYYSKIVEIPYKSPQNLLWMYQGQRKAWEKNCRILLMGAFGNGTVSFDNQMPYMTWLWKHGHWYTLWQEIQALKSKYHYTRKSVLKTTIYNGLPWNCEKGSFEKLTNNSYSNKKFLKENANIKFLIKRMNRESSAFCHYNEYMKAFITLDILRHYGEFAQKTSLYSGVVIRDPTRDKRMIEFTRAIPKDQFTKYGVTRRLIREYMSDLIPVHVLNEKRIGRQSADLKMRILQDQEQIRKEWLECFKAHEENECIDCRRAVEFIEKTPMSEMTDFQMVRIIYSCILLEYLEKYK